MHSALMQASLGATAWFGFLWAAETYGSSTIQAVRTLHMSGNSKWKIPQEGLSKAAGRNRYLTEPADVWQRVDRTASEVCGVRYSGCVLRSSRVLFEGSMQDDVFLLVLRRESGRTDVNCHIWSHRTLGGCQSDILHEIYNVCTVEVISHVPQVHYTELFRLCTQANHRVTAVKLICT